MKTLKWQPITNGSRPFGICDDLKGNLLVANFCKNKIVRVSLKWKINNKINLNLFKWNEKNES